MNKYNTQQAADALHITRETLRQWCLEFKPYLSPDANPGKGHYRFFSDEDMRVLALVGEFRRINLTFDDAHTALSAGQRRGVPDMQPVPANSERSKLMALEDQIGQLRAALSASIEGQQRAAGEIARLEAQLKAAEEKADRLLQENAVLRYRLDQ